MIQCYHIDFLLENLTYLQSILEDQWVYFMQGMFLEGILMYMKEDLLLEYMMVYMNFLQKDKVEQGIQQLGH